MIKLDEVFHNYKDKEVLKNLSMKIETNRLTCLLGGSGCGKTTILRLIAGLEIPIKGKIFINNKLVTENTTVILPPHKRNIGFVFQDLALWPHFTVFKNIAFGLTEKKETNIENTVLNMLEFFSLENYTNKYPHHLSGGQQQLVAIARALVLKPNILLLDEPLANLDVKLKRKILEYIKILKEKFDLTIVYVTHDHREAFSIADKIVVMDEGQIEETGTVNEIKKSENKFVKYFLEY